jgi:hypothetical protein
MRLLTSFEVSNHCASLKLSTSLLQGVIMAKGQQKSNKESKKPRKDNSPPKTIAVDTERPVQKTTAIIPRGKKPV